MGRIIPHAPPRTTTVISRIEPIITWASCSCMQLSLRPRTTFWWAPSNWWSVSYRHLWIVIGVSIPSSMDRLYLYSWCAGRCIYLVGSALLLDRRVIGRGVKRRRPVYRPAEERDKIEKGGASKRGVRSIRDSSGRICSYWDTHAAVGSSKKSRYQLSAVLICYRRRRAVVFQ